MKNMKILVVDRDPVTLNLVMAKAKQAGHDVAGEPDKGLAVDRAINEHFDMILIDTSPMSNARPVIQNFRHRAIGYSYISLMSRETNQEGAIKAGANDVLVKPFQAENLLEALKGAECFLKLMFMIGDESEDFPSAGGVISKSAFNQLFLSAIDRTSRYGERANLLTIRIENYDEIISNEDAYSAGRTSAELAKLLADIRRQSDVLAQTGKGEYTFMLQRPQYATEPLEAAKRFFKTLYAKQNIFNQSETTPLVSVNLVELPVGDVSFSRYIHEYAELAEDRN